MANLYAVPTTIIIEGEPEYRYYLACYRTRHEAESKWAGALSVVAAIIACVILTMCLGGAR